MQRYPWMPPVSKAAPERAGFVALVWRVAEFVGHLSTRLRYDAGLQNTRC
jgi:hypothetical protein